MAKKQSGRLLNFVAWLTGVIVSLAVGFSMTNAYNGGLTLPFWLGGPLVSMIAGWVVIATTLVSAGLAILNK